MNLPLALLAFSLPSSAATPVLAPVDFLKAAGVKPLAEDASIGVGYARLTEAQQEKLSRLSHEAGKCGGFEALPEMSASSASSALGDLAALVKRDRERASLRATPKAIAPRPEITAALAELKAENIQKTVEWLSAFPSRYNKLPDPNQHVVQLEARLREMLKDYKGTWSVDQIAHTSTRQKSLRVRLEGTKRASEIVVLGGHLDSINQWGSSRAPGADDNASGSATLIEALRVLASRAPAERTVEFFFYAGEESGLLGSAEIARQYKSAQKNVVAVLQLDMTSYPGSGQLVIGNVDDYTSPWLRNYLVSVNDAYIGARLIADRCGYACSDHASWYRQGYPTLMPFESDTEHMNGQIHTEGDTIANGMSFTHALAFAKIAVVMGMDLANSADHQP